MTRIRRGYIAQRRRTKIRLFASSFRGSFKTYSNYYSTENTPNTIISMLCRLDVQYSLSICHVYNN
uniref:Large ribosomal subunit protein bL20c n=1 Tax=Kalanchoe fedtschenkoi TaxID=63787 RepID=A0A7N0UYI3_KALFE